MNRKYNKIKPPALLLKGDGSAQVVILPGQAPVIGTWIENVFIPNALRKEIPGWEQEVSFIAAMFPNTPFFVSSIISNMYGEKRGAPSHNQGLALDMAAMSSETQVTSSALKSPRLAERLPVLSHLANNIPAIFPAVAVEGDHFHLDRSLPCGVYSYPTYRPETYKGDKDRQKEVVNKTVYSVKKDGSLIKTNATRTVSGTKLLQLSGYKAGQVLPAAVFK
jgi:hypothetical protein